MKYTKRPPYIPPVLDKDYSAIDPVLKAEMDARLAIYDWKRSPRILTDDESDDNAFSEENGDGTIY